MTENQYNIRPSSSPPPPSPRPKASPVLRSRTRDAEWPVPRFRRAFRRGGDRKTSHRPERPVPHGTCEERARECDLRINRTAYCYHRVIIVDVPVPAVYRIYLCVPHDYGGGRDDRSRAVDIDFTGLWIHRVFTCTWNHRVRWRKEKKKSKDKFDDRVTTDVAAWLLYTRRSVCVMCARVCDLL